MKASSVRVLGAASVVLALFSSGCLGPANQPPVARATVDRPTLAVGEEAIFDASDSSDDRGIFVFKWDFGDGSSSSTAISKHSYSTLGNYTVVLTVTDADGASDNATLSVDVAARVDYVVLEISIGGSSVGSIRWALRADAAPLTASRIRQLVSQGFYDGLGFHRVIPGFVAQGGDPKGDGTGGSGTTIPWEDSPLKNIRGTVAMARGSDINSADSQFFINLIHNTGLDKGGGSAGANQYVVFAEVVSGMDVVDAIAAVGSSSGTPTKEVKMTRVYIG